MLHCDTVYQNSVSLYSSYHELNNACICLPAGIAQAVLPCALIHFLVSQGLKFSYLHDAIRYCEYPWNILGGYKLILKGSIFPNVSREAVKSRVWLFRLCWSMRSKKQTTGKVTNCLWFGTSWKLPFNSSITKKDTTFQMSSTFLSQYIILQETYI